VYNLKHTLIQLPVYTRVLVCIVWVARQLNLSRFFTYGVFCLSVCLWAALSAALSLPGWERACTCGCVCVRATMATMQRLEWATCRSCLSLTHTFPVSHTHFSVSHTHNPYLSHTHSLSLSLALSHALTRPHSQLTCRHALSVWLTPSLALTHLPSLTHAEN